MLHRALCLMSLLVAVAVAATVPIAVADERAPPAAPMRMSNVRATFGKAALKLDHGRLRKDDRGAWVLDLAAKALACGANADGIPHVTVRFKDAALRKVQSFTWSADVRPVTTTRGKVTLARAAATAHGTIDAPPTRGFSARGPFSVVHCAEVVVKPPVVEGAPTKPGVPRPTPRTDPACGKHLYGLTATGGLRARDFRQAWLALITGSQRTDEENYEPERADLIDRLSGHLMAFKLPQEHTVISKPPDLQPGDLLIHSLPWEAKGGVILVHAYTAGAPTIDATIWNEADGTARRDRSFALSADPSVATEVFRAGILWMRAQKSACAFSLE